MSTLLVATLIAFQRHARQTRHAQRVLEAVAAADNLLGTWFSGAEAVPRDAGGLVADDESFSWRTRPAHAAAPELPGIEVVRLEINEESAADDLKPLVAVDVVVGSATGSDDDAAN
ncbi:MAG TPA: hypothetical protein VMV69_02660 [Pirellulales bacterium]|nr:hypothetical protein [Pirellulales bacterium]